ncbi:hypothetical protein CsSME_00003170 [Camellia sinensis var. sinensis]
MGGGGGVAEASESDAGVTIHIRCSNGSKFSVQITLVSTVGSFKSVLAHNCDIPAEHQRLIYKGRILKDDQTLQSYGLEADHTVHLVRGFAPTATTNTGLPNSTPSGVRSVGSDEGGAFGGSGLGDSLFSGLGFNGLGGNIIHFQILGPLVGQEVPKQTPLQDQILLGILGCQHLVLLV